MEFMIRFGGKWAWEILLPLAQGHVVPGTGHFEEVEVDPFLEGLGDHV